jgi:hypothetical protein
MSFKPEESLIRAGIAPDSSGSKVFFNVAAYVLGAFTLSPLLFVSVPPLVDYPDHLARMWILVYGSENYVANWHLLPTLAMDLVVPPLAQILPVEAAGKLFICADDGATGPRHGGIAYYTAASGYGRCVRCSFSTMLRSTMASSISCSALAWRYSASAAGSRARIGIRSRG